MILMLARAATVAMLCVVLVECGYARMPDVDPIDVRSYPSLQAALDANPARVLQLPAADYLLHERLRIVHDGSGLSGAGRIIQLTPSEPILEIHGVAMVRIEGLTLTRPEGRREATAPAVDIRVCDHAELRRLHVLDNHSQRPSISVIDSTATQITDCLVLNYTSLGIDDRMDSVHYGYAFRCMDGTGIGVRGSRGTLIRGNRVIEQRLRPTPEFQALHLLGQFTTRTAQRGSLVSEHTWDQQYVDNWHQGAAILVTVPDQSRVTRIMGNHIENAAQGIDLHCDQVIVSDNVLVNARSGMKAMHGSRHVTIIGNQFSGCDLWAIAVHPGAASHEARAADADGPARPQNVDAGTIIAHNTITDFGYGPARWIWREAGPDNGMGSAIRLGRPQEPSDPPLRDVIIEGNVIYDSGRDPELVDGVPLTQPPRYHYALWIAPESEGGPRNVIVRDNVIHPGKLGRVNLEAKP